MEETINAMAKDGPKDGGRVEMKIPRNKSERKATRRIKKEIRRLMRHIHQLQKQ